MQATAASGSLVLCVVLGRLWRPDEARRVRS